MRSLQEIHKIRRATATLMALLATSACAPRSGQTPTSTAPSVVSSVSTPSTPITSEQPSQLPPYSDTLNLNEVRLTETAGQRSLLLRFSRPPEGIDYFPLRNPNRLVIDVKGPIEPLTKVSTYKAVDTQISAVRVGSYQGRLRLVVDLKGATIPQFSVDHYETLISAFIGEKDPQKSSAQSNSQVLFVAAEEGLNRQNIMAVAVAKKIEEKAPTATGSPVISAQIETESTKKLITSEALPEEKLSSAPIASAPNLTKSAVEKPIDVAQAAPVPAEKPEVEAPATMPRPRRQRIQEEQVLPTPDVEADFTPVAPTQYSGRKISLDFKSADIHDVFRILADVSGLNIVTTDDVKARVTLRLVEIPWDQALDVVLQANGLEKSQVGNVITISTTRRLEAERNARLLAQNAQQKIAPLETAYIRVNYVKATDIVSIITREIEQRATSGGGTAAARGGGAGGRTQIAIMSPRGTIAADPTTNVVIVRDSADRIAAVRELIKNVDVQTPQVVIESYIITTNENLNRDLGIQWGYQYTASPETGNPTGVNFPGRVGIGGVPGLLNSGTGGVPFLVDFPSSAQAGQGSVLDIALGSLSGSQALNLRLSALENQGKARVIARPRVVTLNNKVAEIKARRVVRVPVVSGRTAIVTGQGGTGGQGNAFEEFDVGITLKITPQISSDGYVLLEIDAESSELTDPSISVGGSGNAFPVIPDSLSRTTSSSVLIKANETFVLGGIFQDNMRQTERGIPYLRDTPGLGWLFRSNLRNKNKDELMVFVTPKLVTGTSVAGLPSAQQLWENRSGEGRLEEKSAAAVAP